MATAFGNSNGACPGGFCMGSNTHPQFDGQGVLNARLGGMLNNTCMPPPCITVNQEQPGDFYTLQSFVPVGTFNGGMAVAMWNGVAGATPLPVPVNAFDEKNGFYTANRELDFAVSWNVGINPAIGTEFITFPTSIDATAQVVPEPADLPVFGVGTLVLLVWRGRDYRPRRKSLS
jgi:hypothetical protein